MADAKTKMPATTHAADAAAAKPKLPAAAARAEAARRRVEYMEKLGDRAPIRARIADVAVDDLPAYIRGLKDLGLLDKGERSTVAGNVYRFIGRNPPRDEIPYRPRTEHAQEREATPAYFGPDKRVIWQHIGGDEPRLNATLADLLEKGLIVLKKGHYTIGAI